MADQNLKDFSVSWALFGLLFFCLLTFTISFMFYNNPIGLGDSQDIFTNAQSSVQGNLVRLPNQTNVLLNVTSVTNPEDGYLGSRDSVATSYGITGTGKGFLESTKIFISWVFTGDSGVLLLSVFGGLFGLVSLYYITKWIRNGF